MSRPAATVVLVAVSAALLYAPARDVPLLFDALSYAAQGASLAQGQGNTVQIGGQLQPGVYPVGVPLLVAAPIAWTGDLRTGVWSILACGVLAVLVTASVARRLGGPPAGVLAALLLLSSGAFRDCAGNILSQVPTALAVIGATWLFVVGRGRNQLAWAGAVAVLSVLLRNANAGFPAALVVAACVCGPAPRWKQVVGLGAGMLPAAALVLLHNQAFYGSPWSTGYDVWDWQVSEQYSLLHVVGGADPSDGDWPFLQGFLGLGQLYSVPLLLAAMFGVRQAWRRRAAQPAPARLAVLTCTAVAAQYALHVPYSFHAESYLVPTVPLMAVMAAFGVGSLLPERRQALAVAAAALLVVLSLARAEPLSQPKQDAVRTYESLHAVSAAAEPDAVLLTASEPAMVEQLFLPVGRAHQREVIYLENYNFGPLKDLARQDFDAPRVKPHRVLQRANQLLRAGRPVYFSLWAPSRVLKPVHHEIHVALRKNLDLQPTGIENVYRVELPVEQG